MSDRERDLVQKAGELERDLRIALASSEDVRALKTKCKGLLNKLWLEKKARIEVENEKVAISKKYEMLYDQMEKFMFQMRLMSDAKMRETQAMHDMRLSEIKYKRMIHKQGMIIKTTKR
jgi:hypothetical protein